MHSAIVEPIVTPTLGDVDPIGDEGYVLSPVPRLTGKGKPFLQWFDTESSETAYCRSVQRSASELSDRIRCGVEEALGIAGENGYRGIAAYYGDRPCKELIDCAKVG
ncbi:hypothetical protein BH11ARM2_BH11ARM2_23280 [soil metagenome]